MSRQARTAPPKRKFQKRACSACLTETVVRVVGGCLVIICPACEKEPTS